jgi:fibronectin-binding autotransporter adhesin
MMRRLFHSRGIAFVAVTLFWLGVAPDALCQTVFTWNNSGTDWSGAASWAPAGPPASGGVAEFNPPTNGATPTNPVLNAAAGINELYFAGGPGASWTLVGSGALTTNVGGFNIPGLMAFGMSTDTINLGNGTATSLSLTSGNSGVMDIGTGATVDLTGNTVAVNTTSNAGGFVRGGTLVLDNSAGNPTTQRYTTQDLVATNLEGGGTMEFRGAAAGTTFDLGPTRSQIGIGSGDLYLRTVATGSAALTVTNFQLDPLAISNRWGIIYLENIGTGFVGDASNNTRVIDVSQPLTVSNGVLSHSSGGPNCYAIVTNRATNTPGAIVTGRWAGGATGIGIFAAATQSYTGDITALPPANTSVLFSPSVAGTYQLATSVSGAIPSVSLEPEAAGVTLNANNGFNTTGILLSGGNNLTITGSDLFSNPSRVVQTLVVLNPTTVLTTSAAISQPASGAVNIENIISGQGTIVFNGTTNQLPASSSAVTILKLNGGVLRGTATNLNWAAGDGTELDFRGGVLEYDVGGGSASFTRSLTSSQVTWSAGDGAGSGGFSAYAGPGNGNGNTLTVNLANNSNPVTWGSAGTLRDEYALKFGSATSNSTVIWQNAIDLSSTTTYHARQINVTLGVGNSADKTQMTGLIEGGANADLLKTGTGALELSANNSYTGNTFVQAGTLRAMGQTSPNSGTGMGSVFVSAGATLGGTGRIAGAVTLNAGGTILPGNSSAVGTLTLNGGLTVIGAGIISTVISGTGSPAPFGSGGSNLGTVPNPTNINFVNLTGGAFTFDSTAINLAVNGAGTTFTTGQSYSYQIAQVAGQNFSTLDIVNPAQFTNIGFTPAVESLTGNSSGAVFLNITPVPEPTHVLFFAGVLAAAYQRRRRWLSNGPAAALSA